MNSHAQTLKVNAFNCLRAAQRVNDAAQKSSLLQLAQIWRELAEQAERLDQERGQNTENPAGG